ncbi:hypothetical protein EDB92DRAFT_732752 [Lactarius akahatsu]|uniref:Uncharacterized protein n=1 Tax=Lactarius akahatsu TaxID=416441 RepID=A0AAD4QDD0_9AGAM|nr:hypothetical protein EDB92DRAFT_732752 [Lactarius akahatsu]
MYDGLPFVVATIANTSLSLGYLRTTQGHLIRLIQGLILFFSFLFFSFLFFSFHSFPFLVFFLI